MSLQESYNLLETLSKLRLDNNVVKKTTNSNQRQRVGSIAAKKRWETLPNQN
jgi:hypothetical protein